jgi:hypothetical protein
VPEQIKQTTSKTPARLRYFQSAPVLCRRRVDAPTLDQDVLALVFGPIVLSVVVSNCTLTKKRYEIITDFDTTYVMFAESLLGFLYTIAFCTPPTVHDSAASNVYEIFTI